MSNLDVYQKYLVDEDDYVPEKRVPQKQQVSYYADVENDYDEESVIEKPKKQKKPKQEKPTTAKAKKPNYVGRFFLCILTFILMIVITVATACLIIVYGPSPTVRNICVLSAKQASATKWVPGLFMSKDEIAAIEAASKAIDTDTVSVDDIVVDESENEWADAKDGMKLIFRQEANFKAYILLIKDPSRVKLGVSSDNFATATEGMRIFDMAAKYNCVAAINAGEFSDPGGSGTGATPMGITYSDGKCVWQSGTDRTFIGFDKDNKLVVREGLTQKKAEELGVRDGCCFMTGNVIIERDGDDVKLNYANDNLGIAQKTAIGQRKDGTVIMIVTDGRSTDSVGATRNDMIDLMVEYGAVAAGSLDGGSSSMLYYRNYFDVYNIDKSGLDEYQAKGLVNKYKAFTNPRRIPTYFIVTGE